MSGEKMPNDIVTKTFNYILIFFIFMIIIALIMRLVLYFYSNTFKADKINNILLGVGFSGFFGLLIINWLYLNIRYRKKKIE